jgi:hypothetical protein
MKNKLITIFRNIKEDLIFLGMIPFSMIFYLSMKYRWRSKEDKEMSRHWNQQREISDQELANAITQTLLPQLAERESRVLAHYNLNPNQLFLAFDSVCMTIGRFQDYDNSRSAIVKINRNGKIWVGKREIFEATHIIEMNGASNISEDTAQYLIRSWIPTVLLTQPRLFLGLSVVSIDPKTQEISLKAVNRRSNEDLNKRWKTV